MYTDDNFDTRYADAPTASGDGGGRNDVVDDN